jgi:hypothetical protein
LLNSYGKLRAESSTGAFDIKIKMDNGVNGWGLLAGLTGIAFVSFTAVSKLLGGAGLH